jgi:hypothetical protein
MLGLPRLRAPHQQPPLERAAPHTASGRLRQRVLGAVRSEVEADGAPRARHLNAHSVAAIAAATTIAAAIAVSLAVSQSHSAHTARTGARAPLALLHDSGGHAELTVSGMPEPPIGEVYEVWLDGPGARPRSTDALFTVTSAGNGSVEVPGNLRGVREVMVTSEPLGGSSPPTSQAVLGGGVVRRR